LLFYTISFEDIDLVLHTIDKHKENKNERLHDLKFLLELFSYLTEMIGVLLKMRGIRKLI